MDLARESASIAVKSGVSPSVSILVLMDLARELLSRFKGAIRTGVSILVLMDLAREY